MNTRVRKSDGGISAGDGWRPSERFSMTVAMVPDVKQGKTAMTALLLPENELVTSHRDARPVRRRWWPFGRRAA